MRLDTQRLLDTKHLEEEGEFPFLGVGEFFEDGFGEERGRAGRGGLGSEVGGEEGGGGGGEVGGEGYVGAHPELHAGEQ